MFLALIVAMGCMRAVLAVVPNPAPVCLAGSCTVTFEFSGEPYLWVPPTGATNLSFELLGGQGGRGARSLGGLGGGVSGEFLEMPEQLLVFVGGAGSRSSGAEGGFNGGGWAGSGQGDEASGGGATDLRISNSIEDRIAVAGGGGGAGARNWDEAGRGGSGGTLLGAPGTWGQAGPGGGGSQMAGGQGGVSVGGPPGLPGEFGRGGKGASSRFAGGGGGGGGYFGGGGGGSDIDSGGLNGGGGGGGSNYFAAARFKGVSHQAGINEGAGRAILKYEWVEPMPTKSADASGDSWSDAPADASRDASTDASVDSSIDTSVDSPLDVSTDLQTDQVGSPTPPAPAPEPAIPPPPAPAPAPEPAPVAERSPELGPVTFEIFIEPQQTSDAAVEMFNANPPPETSGPVQVLIRQRLPTLQEAPNLESPEGELASQIHQQASLISFQSSKQPSEQPSELNAEIAPGSPRLQASIVSAWINVISASSLLIGLIQALRRLKQNRRANARRFVRLS